jgi:hypothetical protein
MTAEMRAPSSTISLPARIGTWVSERAEVRVNRGSTWITFAPRSRALNDEPEADRVVLRMLAPMITTQSLSARFWRKVVAPRGRVGRPDRARRACHIRAWVLDADDTEPAVNSF